MANRVSCDKQPGKAASAYRREAFLTAADGEWHVLGRGEQDLRYPGDRSHCQQVCAGLESSTAPAMSLPSGRK
jgi:hypothetical protein